MALRQPIKSKRQSKGEISSSKTLIAPVKGWNARDPISNMGPGYALYLQNWWPTPTNVQLRKGAADHVTGLGATPIKSLAVWNARSGSPSKRIFGCTDAGIYDATTAGTFGAAVSTITDGRVYSVNFGTTGGSYLFCVNNTDDLRYYDGATWTTVANFAITGGGTLLTNTISNINVFKRSLYFLKAGTMEFYYLPIDSIAGSVGRFPLGALFGKGGALVSMGTWSIDGGSGVDDYAAFVTDQGQVALYKGTDPASSTTWALQGVYDLSPPLGKRCFLKFGGDLLYISQDGVYPLSKALQSTTTNNTVAITDLIGNAFSQAAVSWGSNYGWQGIFSLNNSLLLFNIPTTAFSSATQFAMNTKSGAWAQFIGWDAFCWELMDNQLYMGMVGKVAKAWTGTQDFGSIISCYAKGAFDYLGARARMKNVNLLRPNLTINGGVSVSVGVDMDYSIGTAYGPAVIVPVTGTLWDSGVWSAPASMWADNPAPRLDWLTVACPEGYCAAVRLRVISSNATVEWSATDLAFEMGGIQG